MNGEAVHTYTLKLAHCNVNGICNKLQIIRDSLVNSFHPGVLAITESHLTPSIAYATVAIPGYELLRNDSGSSPKHGVCSLGCVVPNTFFSKHGAPMIFHCSRTLED